MERLEKLYIKQEWRHGVYEQDKCIESFKKDKSFSERLEKIRNVAAML